MTQFIQQNKTIAAAVLMLALYLIAPNAKAQKATDLVPENMRTEYVKGIVNNCFPTQRAMPTNKSVTDNEIRKYCTCFADTLTTGLTYGDIEKIIQAAREKKPPEVVFQILLKGRDTNAIAHSCSEAAFK